MLTMDNKSKCILNRLMILVLIGCSIQSCKEALKEASDDKKIEKITKISNDFIQIFDGRSLEGWHGDPAYWSVVNGVLTGSVTPETPLKTNTFLVWKDGEPNDFELKLNFRITESGNSGINYRSEIIDSIPYALRGYQADIDGKIRYTGQNYEERKRATLAYRGEKVIISSQENADAPGSLQANVQNNCWQSREIVAKLGDSDDLKSKIKFEDWNELHLIVKGIHMQHFVNGILMSDISDQDTVNQKMQGKLGMQVHVGPPMKVEYKDIRLKNL